MSLFKRKGSPYWVTELQINGQRVRQSTRTKSRREAAAFEAKLRTAILSGAHHPTQPEAQPLVPMLTLSAAVDRYYREELEPRQHKAKTVRATRYNLSLLPAYFGADRPLDQIDAILVSNWRTSMLASGLAPASVNRRLSDLRAILHKSRRWGIIKEVPQIDTCKLPAPRDRFMSDAEIERIKQACLPSPHLYQLVVFLLGSGGRLGESLDLAQ